MHVEHSPNSRDYNPNMGNPENPKKPAKKDDITTSPAKRASGFMKTKSFENDDEEDKEDQSPIKFVKNNDKRKSAAVRDTLEAKAAKEKQRYILLMRNEFLEMRFFNQF